MLGLPALTILVTFMLYYLQAGFLEMMEAKTYDLRFTLMRGPLAADERIALVAIDEKSIGELGRFPWTRRYYSQLLDVCARSGSKAVLFDVFFPERESVEADAGFAAAVKRSGIATLAVAFKINDAGEAEAIVDNLPELSRAAKRRGHLNIAPDEDGVLRWTPLVIPYGGKQYASLALEGAMAALGAGDMNIRRYGVDVGDIRIPTDSRKYMLIHYAGPPGTFKRYSFSDIIRQRIRPGELKDKILLVGVTALGIYDLRVTPFSNNAPGVEVNANIMDGILRGAFIERGVAEAVLDLLFIAALGLLAGLITFNFKAEIALPSVLLMLGGHVWFSYYMFLKGHWVSIVYPLMSAVMSYTASSAFRFMVVEKKAKEIKSMFSNFVSKKVVEELVRYPEKAKVGGELKTITILFADVRGFTTFSEKHSPAEVVRALNEYLSEMTDTVMKYDGTLDKFLGDGLLAFWGAPLEQKNHAELAVRCALRMLNRMDKLQRKWHSENREALSCGIGIHTGEAIVGNIGARDKKMEYTAIGDNVNLTSRIQGLSRTSERPIIISEALYKEVSGIVVVEPLGAATVKGRSGAVDVYALTGIQDENRVVKMIDSNIPRP